MGVADVHPTAATERDVSGSANRLSLATTGTALGQAMRAGRILAPTVVIAAAATPSWDAFIATAMAISAIEEPDRCYWD